MPCRLTVIRGWAPLPVRSAHGGKEESGCSRNDYPIQPYDYRCASGSENGLTQLRYNGFSHLENLRRFRFERISPGAPTQCFEVAANLALFHTFRIAIQEGPAL